MAYDIKDFYLKKKDLKDLQNVTDEQIARKDLIDEKTREIKGWIDRNHGELKIRSLTEHDDRVELEQIVKDYIRKESTFTENEINQIASGIAGFGVIEDILNKDENVTDIRFNGSELIINTPDSKYRYEGVVTESEIESLVTKFAHSGKKQIDSGHPILDVQLGKIRLNAIHKTNAPYGSSMSLRISKSSLVFRDYHFPIAPHAVRKLLLAFVKSHFSFAVSGETGSGKTELQKYLVSPIPFEEAIFVIEEIPETHLKELYPEKDITSVAEQGGNATMSELMVASKRNNATWVIQTETRDKEAYQVVKIMTSGHNIIFTLHAKSVHAIPYVLTSMIAEHYPIKEETYVAQILENLEVGIQMSKRVFEGKTYRWISELCVYSKAGVQMLFTQRLNKKQELIPTYYPLPEEIMDTIDDFGAYNDITDFVKEYQSQEEKR